MRVITFVVSIALFAPCSSLFAQHPTVLPGDKTRLAYGCSAKTLQGNFSHYECKSATGNLANLSVDSIVLEADYGDTQLTVPFSSLARFELNRGGQSRQVAGAVIGGLAGAGTGLFTANRAGFAAGDYVTWTGMLAGVGMVVGALLGDEWVDHWQDVPLGWVRVCAIRQPARTAFGASVTF